MHHLKINELARELVQEIINKKDNYGAEVITLENGAKVLDMKNASWEGGKLVGEICMGGLGRVEFTNFTIDNHYIPSVNVYTSEPIISCMASQLAGWNVKLKKKVEKNGEIKKKKVFESLGSGPARAKSKVEKKLFEEIDYEDNSNCAVIVFETGKLPNEEVMEIVADKCGVDISETYAVCAPTACLTGSIQVAARIVETGIHKFHEIEFPLDIIQDGFGTTTIAPIAKDDFAAMGRTNDSLIAGGMTYYTIKVDKDNEEEIFDLVKNAPANTSPSYGEPFMKIFKEVDYKFYDIDPGLFAPATYTVTNTKTGHSISAGSLNLKLLKKSYKLN
ncbi:MAG: methenyltetrahydromethanopterin cyclohydrolase [Candidatus Lokiarchaeota archaeon]|nr:methenyltetrahydromethanopterin cyclohydrolase [Candidatus Lokiarchaeota archaeon]MBD3199771.1 methenyltetrahydromethanopterin cyclohydrolase [Candidatus Lokiarchaeota archaeon]